MMTTLHLLLLILQVFSCMNVEQVSALIPGKCYLLLALSGTDGFPYSWALLHKAGVEVKNSYAFSVTIWFTVNCQGTRGETGWAIRAVPYVDGIWTIFLVNE